MIQSCWPMSSAILLFHEHWIRWRWERILSKIWPNLQERENIHQTLYVLLLVLYDLHAIFGRRYDASSPKLSDDDVIRELKISSLRKSPSQNRGNQSLFSTRSYDPIGRFFVSLRLHTVWQVMAVCLLLTLGTDLDTQPFAFGSTRIQWVNLVETYSMDHRFGFSRQQRYHSQ